jgi:hypothetical protein
VIDGYDLTMVLLDNIAFTTLLKRRRHLLAKKGAVFVPYAQLFLDPGGPGATQ